MQFRHKTSLSKQRSSSLTSISSIFRNFSFPPSLPRSTSISFSSLCDALHPLSYSSRPFSFPYERYVQFCSSLLIFISIQFTRNCSPQSLPHFRTHTTAVILPNIFCSSSPYRITTDAASNFSNFATKHYEPPQNHKLGQRSQEAVIRPYVTSLDALI